MRGADLGMVFQEPMTSLNPVMSIGAQIVEAIRLHQARRTPVPPTPKRAASWTACASRMPPRCMRRYPHELSGGMRQRVMIAMALSCKPALLIADEPTTALDVTIQAQILQLIREPQRDMDMGVIFITHDMGVVAEVADRVMVIGTDAPLMDQQRGGAVRASARDLYPRLDGGRACARHARHGAPARFDLVEAPPAQGSSTPPRRGTAGTRTHDGEPPSSSPAPCRRQVPMMAMHGSAAEPAILSRACAAW